jgi:hypothetical protein
MRVDFPSGLVAEMRPLTGEQMALIAEQNDGNPSGDSGFQQLLSGCWDSTLDVGPYSFLKEGNAKPDWKRMLKGDMLTGLIALRQMSITDGDEYEFNVRCSENDCRASIKWTVHLSKLGTKKLSRELQEKVRTGAPIQVEFNGTPITFKLGTLAQEEPMLLVMKRHNRRKVTAVELIASQLISIEGVKDTPVARWKWVGALTWGELQDLRELLDSYDCGVETSFEVKCTSCNMEQEVALPLGKRFFSQRKRPKTAIPAGEAEDQQGAASSDGSSRSESRPGTPTAQPSGGTRTAAAGTAA